MEKRILGKTGYAVSAVVYGGIVSSANYAGYVCPDGQAASDAAVEWAIRHGVNYFDVGPDYGDAEVLLGNSLRPYREDVYIACKTLGRTRADAEADFQESLRRLHTDHFDTYQLHALSTMEDLETVFAPGGAMELFIELKEQGLVRKLGVTSHNEDVALLALERYDFDSVLFPLNWHMHMAHGMGDRLLQAAKEKNVGVLAMKSMIERSWDAGDGEARKKYPKSWCKPIDEETDGALLLATMKYVFSLGVDVIVPPGNFGHFRFGAEHADAALSEPLTEEEQILLRERLQQVKDRPFFGV